MITTDLHRTLDDILASYPTEQICVVVDRQIVEQWYQLVPNSYPCLTIENGENSKSISKVQSIWDFLLTNTITRRGVVICVGGGSITDLGGFAASCYKRGIDYINIPTTLLSMVDAGIGGKTGINYQGLKNCIGTFHSPKETLIYSGWLHTLATYDVLSGFSEMLKHALLSDEIEWNGILQYDLNTLDISALSPLITRSIAIKEQIVRNDPYETGIRKALNFGHTFGHAIEELTYTKQRISHGYAVLYGMIAELYLSVTLLGFPKIVLQQLTQLMLHYYGRPQCSCKDRERLITLMQQDKKNERAAEINCTLLKNIGEPIINQSISKEKANEAFDYLMSI